MPKLKKIGILMVNLGTPDSPTVPAVKQYLKEFLWDRRVVEIPRLVWWVVLNLIILNIRPPKSAALYKKIWLDQGSPLLVFSEELGRSLQQDLNERFPNRFRVEIAMRYGSPSIQQGMKNLKDTGVDQYLILPLYPQYSSTTVGSVFDAVSDVLQTWQHIPTFKFVSGYHDNLVYIRSISKQIKAQWDQTGQGECLLFSFHGLPEKSITAGDPYYHQCKHTAKLIAEDLSLNEQQWKLVFQSRFGMAEWLKPYCSEVLKQLSREGIKVVDVVCPGFAVDCLETLEEIAITNRQLFLQSGGSDFRYIPALNCEQTHVDILDALIAENLLS